MAVSILDSAVLKHPKPWWIPFWSLFVTLYGILALNWNLQPIVFLFWWEIILMTGAALIRMLFALDKRPVAELIGAKIGLLLSGGILGGALIMLAVTFSFKAFESGDFSGFGGISTQTRLMTAGYVLGLAFHYFANGQYKTANPAGELMKTLAHLLVLIALLMALAMHFIPAHPEWNQARWVGIAVVVVKFVVDGLFGKVLGIKGKFVEIN